MFENKKSFGGTGVHYSRYIASWYRAGGSIIFYGSSNPSFRKWLEGMDVPQEEIEDILFMATNGKLELETEAKRYLNKN